MRLLILEDDLQRHKAFRRKYFNHEITIVETATDAINKLAEGGWDVVFLDHDLGGDQMVTSGPGTGYEVTEWLAANAEKQPPQVIIHSYNPDGAKRMKQAVPTALLAPGVWL